MSINSAVWWGAWPLLMPVSYPSVRKGTGQRLSRLGESWLRISQPCSPGQVTQPLSEHQFPQALGVRKCFSNRLKAHTMWLKIFRQREKSFRFNENVTTSWCIRGSKTDWFFKSLEILHLEQSVYTLLPVIYLHWPIQMKKMQSTFLTWIFPI